MIPYFSTTFSLVVPIGIRQFLAYSLLKTASLRLSTLIEFIISACERDSTPPPMPISISLEAMALAIVATDYNPDEQNLFKA